MDPQPDPPGQPPPVMLDPPPPVARATPVDGPPARPGPGLFAPDTAVAHDSLGHDGLLAPVAELIAHAGSGTPLSIGLFGGPGAGKSSAASRLAARVEALSAGAARLGPNASPFLPRVLALRVSAAGIDGEPAPAIAEALRLALAASPAYATLSDEAAQAATDPHVAAREAAERLDGARGRLEGERRALDELEGRKARLVDTLLYESAGSDIDGFARANRAAIESRLRGFGFEHEPIAAFKDLAREALEHSGLAGRLWAFARSTYAFKGQPRLLIWAALAFFLAQGCDVARATSDNWLAALRGAGGQASRLADWAEAHLSLLGGLRQFSYLLVIVFLAMNVWRAIRFIAPIQRGARLLRADVDARRARIDAAIAHQTRRADSLAREVEAREAAALEAERRAAGTPGAGSGAASPFVEPGDAARAASFVDHLSAAIVAGDPRAPRRLLAIIDDLDGLAPPATAAFLAAAGRLLSRPGVATLLAADPARLAVAWGGPAEAAEQLDRLTQVSLRLPDAGRDAASLSALAHGILAGASPPVNAEPTDARASVLDAPIDPAEAALVGELAPLAAQSPRLAKRYANTYRLARSRTRDPAALALTLAIESGAETDELAAFGAALDGPDSLPLAIGPQAPRLRAAIEAVNAARGTPLNVGDARAAWAIAGDYRKPW